MWGIYVEIEPELDPVTSNWGCGYSNDGPRKRLRADTTHYPWIWTVSHGWQYCSETPGNLWLWDADLGWLWTRLQYYPNLFLASEKQWVYFLLKGDDSRWFYRYSDGSYLQVE